MDYQSTPEDTQRAYILGIIYVVLAIALAIMLFKIWPPTPWPKDADLQGDEVLARTLRDCECRLPTPSPTPSPTPTPGSAALVSPAVSPRTSPTASLATSPLPSPATSPTASPTGSPTASPSPSPTPTPTAKSDTLATIPITFFGRTFCTSFDERLILLVIIAGILGAFVHGATSLADYIGNNNFNRTWTWFYLLRPAIGMALALVFYFVIRGGFLTTSGGAKDINPYGIAALAGLVGMFSKQATDKLGEVFGTLFRSAEGEGDAKRKDPLKPKTTDVTIKAITPKAVVAGTKGVSIKVTGTNFAEAAKVWLGTKPQETKFENATSLIATITDDLTAVPGTYKLKVVNAEDAESEPVEFTVSAAGGMSTVGATTEKPVEGEAGDEDLIDGCDVELKADTPDEDLPITEGGVK